MPLKEESVTAGFFGSLYNFFVSRIRSNLHIVLIMDNGNKEFLPRCQANPAFYTRCSIQWWDQWGSEGVTHLPQVLLKGLFPDELKQLLVFMYHKLTSFRTSTVIDQLLQIHKSMENRGATPRRFVTLITTYKKVLFYTR